MQCHACDIIFRQEQGMDGMPSIRTCFAKDPVLMAKRVRQKFVKSEQLRGKNFKKGASVDTSASW